MISFRINPQSGVVEAWEDGKYICDMDDFGPQKESVRNDAVEKFRQRRKQRLYRKRLVRLDDEEGRWVTTENDHKIHLNEAGEPDKGNPHVIAAMKRGHAKVSGGKVKYTVAFESLSNAQKKYKEHQAKNKQYREEMERLWDLGDDAGAEAVRLEWKEYTNKEGGAAYSSLQKAKERFRECGAWDGVTSRIQSVLSDKANTNVDLRGMDFDLAEEAANAFEKVFGNYSSMKGAVRAVVLKEPTPEIFGEHGIAAFEQVSGTIYFNSDYFGAGNKEKGIEEYNKCVEEKFHPAGTDLMSCAYHEMGHAFDTYISEKLFGYKYTWQGESVSRRLWNNEIRAAERRGEPLNGPRMRDMLSGYATKDPAEYLAEGFAEYMGSDSPRPAAVRAGKMIEKYMKKAEAAG